MQIEYRLVDGPEIRCIIRNSFIRFEILAEVSMKLVLCDLTPYILVSKYKRFSINNLL